MDPWARAVSLFHEIAAFDATAEVRRQRRERACQGLADWYSRAEGLLLDALSVEIARRVSELGSAGRSIRVSTPSAPHALRPDGVSLRFLSVGFEDQVVTAYSTRQAGEPLMLHWAWQLQTQHRRFPRILSVPGIRVRRGSEQEMVFERVGTGHSVTLEPVGLSDIASEVLAMLAEAAASRRRLPSGERSTRCPHAPSP